MEETPVKAYSKSELAEFYGVRVATLKNWIRKFETDMQTNCDYDPNQVILTPKQVAFVFDRLGNPS